MIVSGATTAESIAVQISDLQNQSAYWESEYTRWFQWADLVTRLIRNGKISAAYKCLYISLMDTYPDILSGNTTEIQVHTVRENAGWISERAAGNFFRDMETIDALEYHPGVYNKKSNTRLGCVKINPEKFPYPEDFDMQSLERKRKAREREEKRRNEIKHQLQILECEKCGSASIVNDVIAKCKQCGHVHDPITDVPSALITIEAEVVELAEEEQSPEEFLDHQALTPRPAPMVAIPLDFTIRLPEPPMADMPCRKCGRPRRECYIEAPAGSGRWRADCGF